MSLYGYEYTMGDYYNDNFEADDFDHDFSPCPKCGTEMEQQDCQSLGCENGEYLDEDGINGDSWKSCSDCNETGVERWCKECGWDDVFKHYLNGKQKDK